MKAILLSSLLLSGCVPVAIFGAGTAVVTSAAEERGVKGVATDAEIHTKIDLLWFDFNIKLLEQISLNVREGRVLLTGTVANPQLKIDAIRLVWQVNGVKEVIDQLEVGKGGPFGTYLKDAWIANQIRTEILFNNQISSVNYTIQCVEGVVYLMGVAQSQEELERVIKVARHTGGVKKVESYVRLNSEKPLVYKKTSKKSEEQLEKAAELDIAPLENEEVIKSQPLD